MVPSIRTMRRWFTQARWQDDATTPRGEEPRVAMIPRLPARAHPLIELILTGYGYPTPPPPGPRGP